MVILGAGVYHFEENLGNVDLASIAAFMVLPVWTFPKMAGSKTPISLRELIEDLAKRTAGLSFVISAIDLVGEVRFLTFPRCIQGQRIFRFETGRFTYHRHRDLLRESLLCFRADIHLVRLTVWLNVGCWDILE